MSENTQVALVSDDALAILQAAGVQLAQATEQVPRISIQGKVFKYFQDGEWHTVTKTEDGETINATMLNAVILGHAPTRAYALFEGGFKQGETTAPVCYSHDAKKPDTAVNEPKSANCEGCEKRVIGSAFSEGGQATRACRESRLISLVIDADKTATPLQLRLAVGSLWQPKDRAVEDEAQGWYAYDAYISMLSKKGIPHPCLVQTRVKFGGGAGVTVLFKMAGLLEKEHLTSVAKLAGSEEVKKSLGLIPRAAPTQTQAAIAASVAEKATPVAEPAPVVEKVAEAPKPVDPVAEKPKATTPRGDTVAAKPKAEKSAPVAEAPASFDADLANW